MSKLGNLVANVKRELHVRKVQRQIEKMPLTKESIRWISEKVALAEDLLKKN